MHTYACEPVSARVRGKWARLCSQARMLAGFLSRRQWQTLGLIGLLALLAGLLGNAVPVLLGSLVNALEHSEQQGLLASEWAGIAVRYFSILLGVLLVREGFQFLRRYLSRKICACVERDLTVQLTRRLLRTELAFFEAVPTAGLRERMMRAVEGYVKLLQLLIQELAPALVLVAGAVVYCLKTQLGIGLVMFLAAPSTLLLATWEARARRQNRLAVHHAEEKLAGMLGEQLDGLETIRAANRHSSELARVAGVVQERRQQEFQQQLCSAWFDGLKGLHDWIFQMAIIGSAVLLTWWGRLDVGYILTFWYLCFNIMTPLRDMHRQLAAAQENYAHLDDLKILMQQPADASFPAEREGWGQESFDAALSLK